MKNLIDKYIKRIKLDYPEDDKLMIDLQDFYREAQQQALILPVVVRQSEQLVCDILKGTKCNDSFPSYKDGKCYSCGGQAN